MNTLTPDHRFLRYFLVIASADTFHEAARLLGKKSRELRRDIVAFEDKLLKTRLFQRRTLTLRSKTLVRTIAGDRFLPAARALEAAIDRAFKSVGASMDRASYLDMRHFDRFVRLQQAGSISAMAKISGRHPERVNTELTAFEDDFLQTQLFQRPRRPLTLTRNGEILLPHAKKTAAALTRLFDSIRSEVPTELALRVGLASTPSSEFYPQAREVFRVAHRDCLIIEIHDSTDNLIAMLRNGQIDLAFVVEPLPALEDLRYDRLFKCVVYCAMRWRHELARSKSISLRQLEGRRLVAYSAKSYPQYHRYLAKFFNGTVPAIAVECEDHKKLVSHIESANYLALVPGQMTKHSENRLCLIPIAPTIRVGVGALCVKQSPRLVCDFIRAAKDCVKA